MDGKWGVFWIFVGSIEWVCIFILDELNLLKVVFFFILDKCFCLKGGEDGL